MADPDLVPELLVTDLAASLRFWRDLCGFAVRYDRPEEGFAYLVLGGAHVMLEQLGVGRSLLPLVDNEVSATMSTVDELAALVDGLDATR